MNNEIKKIIEIMLQDANVRGSIAKENHLLFFSAYFSHYIEFAFADFHREIFALSEDEDVKTLVVTAARGTGKSTILNMSLAIWSILGKLEKKFVVITSHTQTKARQHYTNLRKELEENQLLAGDLGPFREDSGEWGSSLVLPYYGARITFASTEQSIRGIRHKQYRPDLIIADDLEDNDSVKTVEGRNKTYEWLTKDILPAGDSNTKLVVIGTLLHEDSIMMRLKEEIVSNKRSGVYREYPLIDDDDNILWPGKYSNEELIEAERLRVGDEKAWFQEYLLKIISDADRVIHPSWIQRYDSLPSRNVPDYKYTWSGCDVAISQKTTSDCFATVSAQVHGYGNKLKIYILPNPINKRIPFPQQVECIRSLSTTLGGGPPSRVFVEGFAYQEALPQQLQNLGYPVDSVKLQGDKREKLSLTSYLVQNGQIVFPKHGAEDLINQLVNFGVEKHDDLADAFAVLIHKVLEDNNRKRPPLPEVWIVGDNGEISVLDTK